MQIPSAAWTLFQLLSLVVEEAFPIDVVAPWRDKQLLTGGLVAQWLRMEFTGLAFRDSTGSPRYSPPPNNAATQTQEFGCSSR